MLRLRNMPLQACVEIEGASGAYRQFYTEPAGRQRNLRAERIWQRMRRASEWKQGFRDGIPICLGYFAVSFALGIKAGASGLTALQAVVMSASNLTSAGEFAGLELIANGAAFSELILSQLIINMRYCLMSCSLSQKFHPDMPFYHRLLIGYAVTDEIFGVNISRKGYLKPAYSYGVISSAVPGWVFGTWCGVLFGGVMPHRILSALGVAIYGMFLAIIVPEAKHDRVVFGIAAVSMAASLVFSAAPGLKEISGGVRIIIITILAAAVAAVLFPVRETGQEQACQEGGHA